MLHVSSRQLAYFCGKCSCFLILWDLLNQTIVELFKASDVNTDLFLM